MSPFQDSKRQFLIIGLLIIFHLLLISYQVPLGSKQTLLEKFLMVVFTPVQKVVVGAYEFVTTGWQDLRNLSQLKKKSQELEKEVFFLRQENQLLQEKLRLTLSQLELKNNLQLISDSVIPARVISFDSSNYYRSAIINRGSADGLVKNLPICDRFGNLVGRTADPITPHEARVVLITSEESGLAVVTSIDKLPGILSGNGQGRCLVKYVMASSPAGTVGEEILTSGVDRVFPPGIRIGRIVEISFDEGIFKKIVVQPYFNIAELKLVAVLKNTNLILR
ncbi:MAG: rod shape-determining protein MreC [Acidobacteriota bacterium]|nr:rod shape-determining protein MreC [Acidobacteriota bacterium]MDW3228528.1 rod shape-determining protein MreC [Acidobacteriota bacterium]MDY0231000.1 rod shape-determining protein MreC [Candidatus Saccharicenans sp.]